MEQRTEEPEELEARVTLQVSILAVLGLASNEQRAEEELFASESTQEMVAYSLSDNTVKAYAFAIRYNKFAERCCL